MAGKKILSFSIGPVQSFIAQARKTKDSFSGSKILSDIIHHVLLTFEKEQIIFPDIHIESKPNRFIVIVDKDFDEREIIEKVENIARQKYIEIAETTYNSVFAKESKPIGFDEQIKDFLDIYWIALDYDEDNYKEIYNELDSLMGAIKNTRIYEQIKYSNLEIGEVGKKCTVCGERNGLFHKKAPRKSVNPSNYKVVRDDFISEKETLCAICFTKRYYEKEKKNVESFPSTAEISLMNVLSKVDKDKEIYDEINSYYNGNFTVDLLYEENINMEYIKENEMLFRPLNTSEERKLIRDLTGIKRDVENKAKIKELKLSKYYTIISFDGDSMGKWLSGEKTDGTKKPLIEFHKELSEYLGEFSNRARDIVKEPRGKIIYAGGEDFLGFINIEYIFEVMEELRELFDTVVNQPLKIYYKNKNENLTFSAGICISHYKTTLSNSIIWAQKMEEKAKEVEGKNAFAIALLKRSGEIRMTNYRWQEFGEKGYVVIEDIKNVIKNIKKGYFSSNFIYTLGETIYMLPGKRNKRNIENKDTINNMIKSEIKRLVTRSADKVEMKGNCDEKIDNMVNSLIQIYNKSDLEEDVNISKNNFMNLLYIIAFLTKEVHYDNRD